MHPNRHEFPDDFAQYFRNRIVAAIKDPRHAALVSYDQAVLTGFADWVRQSGSKLKDDDSVNDPVGKLHPSMLAPKNHTARHNPYSEHMLQPTRG